MSDELKDINKEALKNHNVLSGNQLVLNIPVPLLIQIILWGGGCVYLFGKTTGAVFVLITTMIARRLHKDDPHAFFVWQRIRKLNSNVWAAGKGTQKKLLKINKGEIL